MINGESIIIKDCESIIGEEYDLIFNRLKNKIHTSSELDKDGNAFITVEDIDLFEIKGKATLLFHNGVLDNIVLSPEWNKYDLIKENGKRMHIDEAVYLVYKMCHDFLVEHFGPKVNDEYIPETYNISQYHFADLYISPCRDNMSLVLRGKL